MLMLVLILVCWLSLILVLTLAIMLIDFLIQIQILVFIFVFSLFERTGQWTAGQTKKRHGQEGALFFIDEKAARQPQSSGQRTHDGRAYDLPILLFQIIINPY